MARHMTPNRTQVNFEIPADELNDITRIAKELGVSKSMLIRKGVKVIYDFAFQEKSKMDVELREKLLKTGKIPPMSEILADRRLKMEQLLNKMMYDEIFKASKNAKK